MVLSGLDGFLQECPDMRGVTGIGVLAHAASVDSSRRHIRTIFKEMNLPVKAFFGPQHGMYGQTQDNMIEWEGSEAEEASCAAIPEYSLYGQYRKPTEAMLSGLDLFIVDLQDVGARPYTYIWTVKECMAALAERGIPLWVFDRPNPIAFDGIDGPVLREELFTFVGGASIPSAHGMTMAEMVLWLQQVYFPTLEVRVFPLQGWCRSHSFSDTGLPWVLPSPNMPSTTTARVYPGMVFLEALSISEGRGTTLPFEFFGAPWLPPNRIWREMEPLLEQFDCVMRRHDFIPTFNMYKGEYCHGFQLHPSPKPGFSSVSFTLALLQKIIALCPGEFEYLPPPYEYEYTLLPFDILTGDTEVRSWISSDGTISELQGLWKEDHAQFLDAFHTVRLYEEVL
ncbi:exo-beta-N-acetylmuramidase NamZ domain-containing protein [Chitinivibrio alkaliphilus]|nr:DUF1343 domain-containing protein [Chitinivibrio alkaliphilus]